MSEPPELSSALEMLTQRAEDAWPTFRLEPTVFHQRLLASIGDGKAMGVDALFKIHVVDLYLACGCSMRLSPALEEFATRYLSQLAAHLKRFGNSPIRAEDVRREVEDTLLFGRNGSPARIGQYTGRGTLDRFVATAARNSAVTLLRSQRNAAASDDFDALASQLVSPTLGSESIVAARYERVVQEALRTALEALDRRQRTIVRLHLVQGVTRTQIGRMLKVHQSTVSRALDVAIDVIHREIRRQLSESEGMNDSEMVSIIRDVRHRIDLSLSRILRSTQQGGGDA